MILLLSISNRAVSQPLLALGIAVVSAVVLLFPFWFPMLIKSGQVPKRWQLWMLGEPRNGKIPHRDNIVT